MIGTELQTFITGLNGDATIDVTLLNVLANTAKTLIEDERPFMVLRKTNTAKTASPSNSWQTSIDISTITDFSLFYGEYPLRLFDGVNRVEYYRQIPWDRRLEYKDISNTFTYDENAKLMYINGVVPFSGTLYINYLMTTADIDLDGTTDLWTQFPSRYVPLIGFYAIGIYQGGVDYDSISSRQAPSNLAVMNSLRESLHTWDNARAMSAIEHNDPSELYNFPRSNAIDRYPNE